MKRRHAYRGFPGTFFSNQLDKAIQRFAACANALYRFDAAICDCQNWFEIECGSQEALGTSNPTAAVEEFQCIDREINTDVVTSLFCQSFTLCKGSTIYGGAGNGEYHKSHRH